MNNGDLRVNTTKQLISIFPRAYQVFFQVDSFNFHYNTHEHWTLVKAMVCTRC